jgi:hypothetical protein
MDKINTRLQAMFDELDKALADYQNIKGSFMDARVRYQSARERFAGIRRLAGEMLPRRAWSDWLDKHPDVTFMGMPIGDAILLALEEKATRSALDHLTAKDPKKPPHYDPSMNLDDIVSALERGGFEFRGLSPAREVNAALLKLPGVIKELGRYKKADADKTLEQLREWLDGPASAEGTPTQAEATPTQDDDDVPF